MATLAIRTIQKKEPLTILQRINEKDPTAVKECIDAYGNFIWALARKFTTSTEEAEAATQEIFIDIWRYTGRTNQSQSPEKLVIALIARRQLVKYLQ